MKRPRPRWSRKKYSHGGRVKDNTPSGTEFRSHRLQQLNAGLILRRSEMTVDAALRIPSIGERRVAASSAVGP